MATSLRFLESHAARREHSADRDGFLARMAECYTGMFVSLHPESRDSLLAVWPSFIAQTLHATFYGAFPDSSRALLRPAFRQFLSDISFELFSGIFCGLYFR